MRGRNNTFTKYKGKERKELQILSEGQSKLHRGGAIWRGTNINEEELSRKKHGTGMSKQHWEFNGERREKSNKKIEVGISISSYFVSVFFLPFFTVNIHGILYQ